MYSDWGAEALRRIKSIHESMPGCTADQLRKALRRHSGEFTGGTKWGAKVWPKKCRAYIAQQFGEAPPTQGVEQSPKFGPDITFPFRDGGTGCSK